MGRKKAAKRVPSEVYPPIPALARKFLKAADEEHFWGRFDRALEYAHIACDKAPDWAAPHHLIAHVLRDAVDPRGQAELREHLEVLVRLGDADPIERYRLAIFLLDAGREEEAVGRFQEALQDEDKLLDDGLTPEQLAAVRRLIRRFRRAERQGRTASPAPSKRAPVAPRPGRPTASPPGPPTPAPAAPAGPPAPGPTGAPPVRPPPRTEVLPACGLREVVVEAPDQAAARARAVDLARLRLALDAHRVVLAERFDDLLCLRAITGVTEYAYQVETVRRVLKTLRGRALLGDEVGLGKTIEAGMVLKEFLLRGMVRTALILVPPALVSQWREELQSKFGVAPVTTEDPEFARDPDRAWAEAPVLLASLALARNPRHRPRVTAREYDMLIVDEAHHVKSRDTASWRLVDAIRSRFVLLLTATPVENNLDELYNLVSLIRPGQFGTPREFRTRFLTRGDPLKPRDTEALRRLLSDVMIRNTRAVADIRLPPRFATTLAVEPTPAEVAVQERLLDLLRRHYDRPHARLLIGLLLQEACSSMDAVRATIAGRDGAGEDPDLDAGLREVALHCAPSDGSAKDARLVEFLRRSGEPALVFTRFRATAEGLVRRLEGAGFPCASFHGGLSAAQKDAAVLAVAEGRARVLVATQIGGEGRNLHFLRALVNYDLPWNPMEIEQRIGRVHRIGQKREVFIINLCLAGSAEEHILNILDKKINLFELVVGEMDLILGQWEDSRDFADRVLSILGESRSGDEVQAGFERLGAELEAARRRYEAVRRLDDELFSDDYEV